MEKKKLGGTTLPGGRVSRHSQRVREGFVKPGNIRNDFFEKYLHNMVLNLTVYVGNIISFFYKQKKTGEIPILRIFFGKIQFGLCFTENRQIGQNRQL